jgi:hypothetical protein
MGAGVVMDRYTAESRQVFGCLAAWVAGISFAAGAALAWAVFRFVS